MTVLSNDGVLYFVFYSEVHTIPAKQFRRVLTGKLNTTIGAKGTKD